MATADRRTDAVVALPARSNRLVAAGIAAGVLAVAQTLFPRPEVRGAVLYLLILPLAYGHLLGALSTSRSYWDRIVPEGVPRGLYFAFVAVSVATLFAAYTLVSGGIVLVLVTAVSLWHVIENDIAQGRRSRAGLHLGPIPRDAAPHWGAAGILALASLAVVSTLAGSLTLVAEVGVSVDSWVWVFRLVALVAGMRIVGSRSGRLLGSTLIAGGVIPTSWLGTLVDLDSLISFGLAYHVISWLYLGQMPIHSHRDDSVKLGEFGCCRSMGSHRRI